MKNNRPKFQMWVPSLNTMYPHEMIDFCNLFDLNEEPDDFFLRQYIDKNDSEGAELYAGDIVVNGLSGTWLILPMSHGSFSLKGICKEYKDKEFDISALNRNVKKIGNIYQNPELINL